MRPIQSMHRTRSVQDRRVSDIRPSITENEKGDRCCCIVVVVFGGAFIAAGLSGMIVGFSLGGGSLLVPALPLGAFGIVAGIVLLLASICSYRAKRQARRAIQTRRRDDVTRQSCSVPSNPPVRTSSQRAPAARSPATVSVLNCSENETFVITGAQLAELLSSSNGRPLDNGPLPVTHQGRPRSSSAGRRASGRNASPAPPSDAHSSRRSSSRVQRARLGNDTDSRLTHDLPPSYEAICRPQVERQQH